MLPCVVGTCSDLNRMPRYTGPSFWEVVDQVVPLEIGWAQMMYSAPNSRWGQVQTPRVLNGLLLVVAVSVLHHVVGVCTLPHTHTHTHTHTHALTHMHTQRRTFTHMHTRIHALTHARIHTRAHAQTHTYIHTHSFMTELSAFSCFFIVIGPNQKMITDYTNTKFNLKFNNW